MLWSVLSKNMQEYQKQSGMDIQDMSISLDNPKSGRMKSAKSNSGIIGSQNWSKTGSHLRASSWRLRDCFLMKKYKKSLQKIINPGTSWTGLRSANYQQLKLFNSMDNLVSKSMISDKHYIRLSIQLKISE